MLGLKVHKMGGVAVPVRTARSDVLGVLSLAGLSHRRRWRNFV
jgi:DNA-binding IclR family transcriptional regulator